MVAAWNAGFNTAEGNKPMKELANNDYRPTWDWVPVENHLMCWIIAMVADWHPTMRLEIQFAEKGIGINQTRCLVQSQNVRSDKGQSRFALTP